MVARRLLHDAFNIPGKAGCLPLPALRQLAVRRKGVHAPGEVRGVNVREVVRQLLGLFILCYGSKRLAVGIRLEE